MNDLKVGSQKNNNFKVSSPQFKWVENKYGKKVLRQANATRVSEDEKDIIYKLTQAGKSIKEIGFIIKRNPSTISFYRNKMGLGGTNGLNY